MKQIQMLLLLAVFISTVAVFGQQVASRGKAPADIVYTQPVSSLTPVDFG
jgi:hypothetical protein